MDAPHDGAGDGAGDGPRRRRITRRAFLAAGAAAALGTGGWARWGEPRRVRLVRHALGGTGPALRVVQLSDLHLPGVGARERLAAALARRAAPHLLVITGDAVDDAARLPDLTRFLAPLPRVPTYAVPGNWEHWARLDLAALAELYRRAGATLLHNRTVRLRHAGRDVLLTGLDDATGGVPDLRAALDGVLPAADHLLLAHSPAYRDAIPGALASPGAGALAHEARRDLSGFRVSFVLSGHTHGGQIAPFGLAPLRPPGSGRYVAGWYRDGPAPPLYVSRGIGTSVIPMRLGAPPEVAVFDWRLAE